MSPTTKRAILSRIEDARIALIDLETAIDNDNAGSHGLRIDAGIAGLSDDVDAMRKVFNEKTGRDGLRGSM